MTSRRIETAYTTPSATTALGGAKRLLAAKLAPDERVRKWLRGQEAYTLHKAAPKRFARRPTVVTGRHEQIQADLMDVRSHKDANDGTTFLLTAASTFSPRSGGSFPCGLKTGREVSNALRGLFAGYRVRAFQTDKGKEFLNKDVESVLRDANVKSFVSQDDVVKASIVERFNKTLRAKIHRYLMYTGGSRVSSTSCRKLSTRTTARRKRQPAWRLGPWARRTWKTYGRRFTENPNSSSPLLPNCRRGITLNLARADSPSSEGTSRTGASKRSKSATSGGANAPSFTLSKILTATRSKGPFYEKQLQRVSLPETFRVERVIRSRTR